MTKFYLVEVVHPVEIDKLCIGMHLNMEHKMVAIVEGHPDNWCNAHKARLVTNTNSLEKLLTDTDYKMEYNRTWSEHKARNSMAHISRSDGPFADLEARDFAEAAEKVRSEIQDYLPKVYIPEPTHSSDCHMVGKVARAVYNNQPLPVLLPYVVQSIVGVGGAKYAHTSSASGMCTAALASPACRVAARGRAI